MVGGGQGGIYSRKAGDIPRHWLYSLLALDSEKSFPGRGKLFPPSLVVLINTGSITNVVSPLRTFNKLADTHRSQLTRERERAKTIPAWLTKLKSMAF